MSKTEIKSIVFDYGGVIEFYSKNNPNKIAAEMLGIPHDTFRAEYFKHNHLSNTENVPWEEMFKKVVKVFASSNEDVEKIMKVVNEDRKQSSLNNELISLLPEIKKLGFKVALFSNSPTTLRERLKQNGLFKYFDEVVISGEIGFQKPSKESFEFLFGRLGLKPEEVIFIDDAHKSLESAQEIGYTPILFKDNNKLLSDLRDLGVVI